MTNNEKAMNEIKAVKESDIKRNLVKSNELNIDKEKSNE